MNSIPNNQSGHNKKSPFLVVLFFFPPVMISLLTIIPLTFFITGAPLSENLCLKIGADAQFFMYAFLCVFSFYIAYSLAYYASEQSSNFAIPVFSPTRRKYACIITIIFQLLLSLVSLYFVLKSAQQTDFLSRIIALQTDEKLRNSIIESDVPGAVRMLSYLAPGSLIGFLAMWKCQPSPIKRAKNIIWLFMIIFIATIFRSLIYMDRTSIMMSMVITIYTISTSGKFTLKAKAGIIVLISIVIIVASIQKKVRIGDSDQNTSTFSTYADIGMANASLAFRSTTHFSLGMESLFAPLSTVPRGIGLKLDLPVSNRSSLLDPASNLLGYSLADFGLFGFIVYIVWGGGTGWVHARKKRYRHSLFWNTLYLWNIFALCTIWTIPITRGPEFWCASIISCGFAFLLDQPRLNWIKARST